MPAEPARRPSAAEEPPSDVTGTSGPAASTGLGERDRQILELEGRTFRYVGAKERAIREQIGISKVAYYVRLNALLEDPAALRAAPALVHRLRARRTSGTDAPGADGSHRVA